MIVDYKLINRYTAYFSCCGEIQFEYMCSYCEEPMGCYFCDFDITVKHDCMAD